MSMSTKTTPAFIPFLEFRVHFYLWLLLQLSRLLIRWSRYHIGKSALPTWLVYRVSGSQGLTVADPTDPAEELPHTLTSTVE